MRSSFLFFFNLTLISCGICAVSDSRIEINVSLWGRNLFATSLLCDGVIINPESKYVIVAAHCIKKVTKPYDLQVRAEIDEGSVRTSITEMVSNVYLHPNYNSSKPDSYNIANDIAVLHLNGSLRFPGFTNDYALSMELPNNDTIPYGESFKVNTWGIWDAIDGQIHASDYEPEMKILEPEKCRAQPKETQFCAVSPDTTEYFCSSVRGSPFIVDHIVIGIASFSTCIADSPEVFTKLYPHLSFINGIIKTTS